MNDVIETERLLLRRWQGRDEVELVRLFGDPAVQSGRVLPPSRVRAIHESGLRQWREYGYGPWAAVEKETGQWIGRVGLDELPDWPDQDRVEVGFELSTAWWGRGLATEATVAALHFGFDEARLRRIISTTARDHVVARRVMEKTGLTYRGERRWRDVDVVWYAADRDNWVRSHLAAALGT